MNTDLQTAIEATVSRAMGYDFCAHNIRTTSGGCIHQSYLMRGKDESVFVKVNAASKLDVFKTEAFGLEAIHKSGSILCPRPLVCETYREYSFLAMEALALSSVSSDGWARMGGQLAAMHRHTHQHFGWSGDNYIGVNPQENTWHEDWGEFFCRQRIRPQLQMAHANGYKFQSEAALYEAAKHMLSGHQPEPSLLHGDLWSGNAGFLDNGSPVVYDPACYYGDRETDLAFSELFGGFPKTFYQAYQKAWPVAQGYEQRKILYNLYHVLNHANLFGGGYGSKAQGMIHSLIE